MQNNNLEDMLKKLHIEARPGKWFSFKLRMRLRQKAFAMGLRKILAGFGRPRAFAAAGAPARRFRFAPILLLAVLTLGGGIGTYAYASPDVTVDHPLYPVKQGLESAELYFVGDTRGKAQVHLKHAMRRMAEMEILANRPEAPEMEQRAERTLNMLQEQMKESLVMAAEEDEVVPAKAMIEKLHKDLGDVDEHLGRLAEKELMKTKKVMRARLEKMKNFTQRKLRRVEEVSQQISSPLRIKGPHVILKRLMEDDADDEMTEKSVTLETSADAAVKTELAGSDVDSADAADADFDVKAVSSETAVYAEEKSDTETSTEPSDAVKEDGAKESDAVEAERDSESEQSSLLNFDRTSIEDDGRELDD